MARLSLENVARALDASGDPISGAKKYTYMAGTTSLANTFTDIAETTAQANPLTADSSGYFDAVYVPDGDYKIRVTDASDNLLWEADNIAQGADRALPAIMLAAFGQSNIASTNSQAAGGSLASDSRIKLWDGSGWVTWTPSTGMGVGAAGRNSILFQAAKEAIAKGYPKVYCVVDAHAGQAISYWTASGTSSTGYASLKTQMDAAFASADIVADSITALHGLIWGQGESDGGGTFVMTTYQTSFEALKTQWRAESWMSRDTPIVCLEMPTLGSASIVNRYFLSELPYDSDPYTFTVRTEGLDDGTDTLHWSGVAMNYIGERAFKLIEQRVAPALPHPYRVDADAYFLRLEEINGKGLGVTYSDSSERINMGPTSDVQFPSLVDPKIIFDINDGYLMFEDYTYAAGTFECQQGFILESRNGSNFADLGDAVNTDASKKEGMMYWDAANNRIVVANGSADASTWSYFSADNVFTPA